MKIPAWILALILFAVLVCPTPRAASELKETGMVRYYWLWVAFALLVILLVVRLA